MDWGRSGHLARVALLIAVAAPQSARWAVAAHAVTGDEGGQPSEAQAARQQSVFTPPDRATLRLLRQARQLIDEDRYAEAIRCLGAILEGPQDYFLPADESPGSLRGLKTEVQQLLAGLSARGRRLYELQYGARARQMLAEAVTTGDAAGLEEVSSRFFHSQAGYEATLLLGLHRLDHGRPVDGAITLERLREAAPTADQFEPALSLATAICWIRAGEPEKAGRTLAALEERFPGLTAEVAGEEVPLFAREKGVLAWLDELAATEPVVRDDRSDRWSVHRGNATRNAAASGDRPLLSTRWRVRGSDHPYLEALLAEIRDNDRDWDRVALPALHPLVVEDLVLMRTPRNLLAVDFETGKRLWEAPVDDPFASLLDPPETIAYRRVPQLEYALRLRMWADATYGSMSSDGDRVYAIEDLGLEIGATQFQAFIRGRRVDDPTGPRPHNRLAAYDLHAEGKLAWHAGGSSDDFELPLAGTFFLGPPLPLMGRLYAIGERMGEISLIVLEAASGELLWSQQLAGADQLLMKNPLRRIAGVSPSYAEGVLVCPTSNRSVVAVELATRSLLWGYEYSQSDGRSRRQVAFLGSRSILDPDPSGRWIDSSVILAEGRVLVSPLDSDWLHCLDLRDGRLLWKAPREDGLYVACVHEGKVVLVGRRAVRALDLHQTREAPPADDPEPEPADAGNESLFEPPEVEPPHPRPAPAWGGRTVALPEGSRPTGVGFRSQGRYYLPLSTAEVMAVDLAAGEPVGVSRSRHEVVPGNLTVCGGRVLSQDAAGLQAFDQLESLRRDVQRRLARDPDDAEALCLEGEILWDEGELDEAVRSFRRSWELEPNPRTRGLLRDALLDGLRTQFAAHRDRAAEIERLIDEPSQRATYLRWMALGLADCGEFGAAWEHYQKLIALDSDHPEMERLDPSLSVRRDRWIQVRLAALRESAPEEIASAIDEAASARLRAASAEEGPEPIRRFLRYFGLQPIADEARRRLVDRYRESGEWLGAELLVSRAARSSDPSREAATVAEWADLLRASPRANDAAFCYERLGGELADAVCRPGKTGRELVESLPKNDPVRRQLEPGSLWPTGRVVVSKSTPKTAPPPNYNKAPVTFEGSRAPFFSDVTVELQQSPLARLVGRDGFGRAIWRLPLSELAQQGDSLLNRSQMRVSACGHMLVLSSGRRILAADTLGAGPRRLLWTHNLDRPASPDAGTGLPLQLANLAAGMPQVRLFQHGPEHSSPPRIVNEQLLCFKQLRSCVAVDPWTGETLWIRRNVARDAELFGDHEYVFLVRSGETTATVLRALDGELLGEREVPRDRQTALGRHVLAWRREEDRSTLEMVDPWEGRAVWPPKHFADDAKLRRVDEIDAAAVYEPAGRFVLVDLHDGRTIVDAPLESDWAASEFFVLCSADQVILVLYERGARRGMRSARNMQVVSSVQIGEARVYAFDAEGKPMWPSPRTVENQCLPVDQPNRLPVLTFISKVQEPQGNARARAKTAVLCIDKRTGRKVYAERLPGATNSFAMAGDPEKRTVEMRLQRNTITLTFTDEPLPPKSDTETAGDGASGILSKAPAAARAVWNALRAAMSGAPADAD